MHLLPCPWSSSSLGNKSSKGSLVESVSLSSYRTTPSPNKLLHLIVRHKGTAHVISNVKGKPHIQNLGIAKNNISCRSLMKVLSSKVFTYSAPKQYRTPSEEPEIEIRSPRFQSQFKHTRTHLLFLQRHYTDWKYPPKSKCYWIQNCPLYFFSHKCSYRWARERNKEIHLLKENKVPPAILILSPQFLSTQLLHK